MAKKSKEAAAETKGPKKVPTPRLMERYFKEIVPRLTQQFQRTNVLSLPRLRKIVINMGVGKAITEKKFIEEAVEAMKTIAGQKPVVTRSRLSIAGFKLREGQAVGCKVTLRGKRMRALDHVHLAKGLLQIPRLEAVVPFRCIPAILGPADSESSTDSGRILPTLCLGCPLGP